MLHAFGMCLTLLCLFTFFCFHDTAASATYTLSLHDALPILIGGSIGLAARERLGATVRGFDPGDGVLEAARERGAIDEACATADRKSTRLNSSHTVISYAVFCLKKKNKKEYERPGICKKRDA